MRAKHRQRGPDYRGHAQDGCLTQGDIRVFFPHVYGEFSTMMHRIVAFSMCMRRRKLSLLSACLYGLSSRGEVYIHAPYMLGVTF